MSGRVPGISKTSLWQAWKAVRKEFRRCSLRDVIDYMEYDLDPDVWIRDLLRSIQRGTYEPHPPRRFLIAKSNGFSRRMTMPHIPDLVLYRAIVDRLYRKSRRSEHRHVYFERTDLAKAQANAKKEASSERTETAGGLREITEWLTDYDSGSHRRYRAWLHYDQYRKHLILKRIYPFIVTTDVANFFDTILHCRIADSLQQITAPSGVVNLLFLLLERLGSRPQLKGSARIGVPVDEFDCSRKLAHMVLYPHDDHLVRQVGEEAYVRWMDDQVFGASSRRDALTVLAAVGASLSELNLTPNAGKSKILTTVQARRHYHLDVNAKLDDVEQMIQGGRGRTAISKAVGVAWKDAKRHAGNGQWEKILKRVYRMTGIAKRRSLRRRAIRDLLAHPHLATRISDYIRCTGAPSEYIEYVEAVWNHPEQVYDGVNRVLAESLLRLEATRSDARTVRRMASEFLARKRRIAGWRECCAVAPLLILRYGDKRSLPLLRRFAEGNSSEMPFSAARSAAIVYASFGGEQFGHIRRLASRLHSNYLAMLIRMVERIRAYKDVPGRLKARMNPAYDAVSHRQYFDMRSLLAARLLGLNRRKAVSRWLADKRKALLGGSLSDYDKAMVTRLWPS